MTAQFSNISVRDDLTRRLQHVKSIEDMAAAAVEVCAEAAHAEICTFWRRYNDDNNRPRLRLAAAFGVGAPATLAQEVTYEIVPEESDYRGIGVTGYVASAKKEVIVHSFQQLMDEYGFCHQGRMDKIQWKDKPEELLRNLFAVPLVLGDSSEGVIKVENCKRVASSFTETDLASVRSLTERLAIIAKTLHLLDSHEQRLIEAPARLSQALLQPFEQSALTQDIVDTTAEILDAQICSLWVVTPTGSELVHQANHGVAAAREIPRYRIDVNPKDDKDIDGITAWVAIRRKPFWANSHRELREHPSWRGTWDPSVYGGRSQAETAFHSMYAVPLVWNDELFGVLKVENPKNAFAFTRADHRKCDLMANFVVLLLALTKNFKINLLPGMAHAMNSPAAGLATQIDAMDRELRKKPPDFARLRDCVDSSKSLALSLIDLSRTLTAEIVAKVAPQRPSQTDVVRFVEQELAMIKLLTPAGIAIHLDERRDQFRGDFTLPLGPSETMWLKIIFFNLMTI